MGARTLPVQAPFGENVNASRWTAPHHLRVDEPVIFPILPVTLCLEVPTGVHGPTPGPPDLAYRFGPALGFSL